MKKLVIYDSDDNIVVSKKIKNKIKEVSITTDSQIFNFSFSEKNKNKELNNMFNDDDFWNL